MLSPESGGRGGVIGGSQRRLRAALEVWGSRKAGLSHAEAASLGYPGRVTDLDPQAIRARCTRELSYHGTKRPGAMLAELAQLVDPSELPDSYGEGLLIANFEQEIAALLGKEAAVFMPSGTMAQQIALRIWADRKGSRHVAFHPLCHIEQHEQKGYQVLHGLHGVLVGSPHRLMTLAELSAVADPLAALLLELPQRDIGGQLPSWDALTGMVDFARARGVALHLDGARLWETKPFYGRSYAEIAGLFDSVYVSFYKGLGGIAGCALAGPKSFIAEARVWQRRHGGTLVQQYPYVLSAQAGMRERLGRMDRYVARAIEVARLLAALPEISVVPDPPQTNMMHLHLRGEKEVLEAAALELSRDTGVWMFTKLRPTSLPSLSICELSVGDALLAFTDEELVALFRDLFARARRGGG
jgi:threonine aldolase